MAASITPQPILVIQSDWNEVLRQKDGQAWIECKTAGHLGIHGHVKIKSEGIGNNLEASGGFTVNEATNISLDVSHTNPDCRSKFIAPKSAFNSIHEKNIVSMDVTSGGLGVSACTGNNLQIWETSRGLVRRTLEGHLGGVYTSRFFPSGVVVLSGGADMQLKVWSAETGQCPVTLRGHTGAVMDTAIVDRGSNVVSVSRDGTARLWDCGQSAQLAIIAQVASHINACDLGIFETPVFSTATRSEREIGTRGKLLLLACEDKTLRGVDIHQRDEVFSFSCTAPVNKCTFLTPTEAICGCEDGSLYQVDVRNPSCPITTWLDTAASIRSILPIQGGFFAGKSDGLCVYYKHGSRERIQLTGPDCDPINCIVTDASHLYTCSRDAVIRKYNIFG